MTPDEKKSVERYRREKLSYGRIADLTGIPLNTIKTYCKRHGLGGRSTPVKLKCRNCQKPITKHIGPGRPNVFCCDQCRIDYWNANKDKAARTRKITVTCQHCGKEFKKYSQDDRKYCSHPCYIAERFKKGETSEKAI